MNIDIGEVLTEFAQTGKLPSQSGFDLFSAIHKQWVKNGGLGKRGKNIRSIYYLREMKLMPSLYPKLVGQMPMTDDELRICLKFFFSKWGSDDNPHPLADKLEKLANAPIQNGALAIQNTVRLHKVRIGGVDAPKKVPKRFTPLVVIKCLLDGWFEREFGKKPDQLAISYRFGEQKGELAL